MARLQDFLDLLTIGLVNESQVAHIDKLLHIGKDVEHQFQVFTNILVGIKKNEVIGLPQFRQRSLFGKGDGLLFQIIFLGTDVVLFRTKYDRNVSPYPSEVVSQH